MIKYYETRVQEVKNEVLEAARVRLLVKREDLNHPFISGNKWWKLKYNLEEARRLGKKKLLTVGGAYSNHIYATAAAARESGFESIGIIRGEETHPLNSTLTFAKSCGMQLHYISREAYRKKNELEFIELLHSQFGDFYQIPEGGTNEFAVKGCEEFAKKILTEINFDVLCLPVGTGGTMAGIIKGLEGKKEVVGISILKQGDFLENEIRTLVVDDGKTKRNWSVLTPYHHGGYAKTTPELLAFIDKVETENNLPLDFVYTGKLFWGILEEVKKDRFVKGSVLLAIHTGGLQGAIHSQPLPE